MTIYSAYMVLLSGRGEIFHVQKKYLQQNIAQMKAMG